jgi:hypothetical protein
MRDQWYGDKRDLVKWGALLEIVRQYDAKQILLVLFYRPNPWGKIEVDGQMVNIHDSVIQHFRNVEAIRNLRCPIPIEIVTEKFEDRNKYIESVISAIRKRSERPGIIFLDPDTGLEPCSGKFKHDHVRECELRQIWDSLSNRDILVFYQHETNRKGQDFIGPKKSQFASALELTEKSIKIAYAPTIAKDVVFFFAVKQ